MDDFDHEQFAVSDKHTSTLSFPQRMVAYTLGMHISAVVEAADAMLMNIQRNLSPDSKAAGNLEQALKYTLALLADIQEDRF